MLHRLRGLPAARTHLSVRVLPLLAVLSAMAIPVITSNTGGNHETIQRLGTVTAWSVSILVLTTLFPAFTLASLIQVWRARRWKIRREVYWLSLGTTLACAAVALYLGYWGRVAFRTWS